MHVDQYAYVELYRGIMNYDGRTLFADIVQPWLDTAGEEQAWLANLRAAVRDSVEPLPLEVAWRLYALSRCLDVLQLSFDPGPTTEEGWRVCAIRSDEYRAFLAALGLDEVTAASFHPFYHEIVEVETDKDPESAPEVVGTFWPGAMLGSLLIARTGWWAPFGERDCRVFDALLGACA